MGESATMATALTDVDAATTPWVPSLRLLRPAEPRFSLADAEDEVVTPARLPARLSVLYLGRLSLAGESRLELKRPLKIEPGRTEEGDFEVAAPELGLYGVGASIKEALVDLSETIQSLWDDLSRTPVEQLDDSARHTLDRLRLILG